MMENRREYSGLIVLLTVLGALLPGARAQEIQVGSKVTLEPKYTGDLTEITWRRNDAIVVEVALNPRHDIIFDLPKDRVTIDGTNGALTIRNLTINDAGKYMAVAVLRDGTRVTTEIILTVHDPTVTSTNNQPGSLFTESTDQPKAEEDPTVTSTNNQPGSPSTESTDQPKAEEGQSGLSAGAIAGIALGVIVAVIAGVMLSKIYRKREHIPSQNSTLQPLTQ